MCGIAGIVDLTGRPVDGALLRSMTAVIAHRGPDGDDIVCRGNAGLGHRRLAIIDLVTGDQPMVSDDGLIRITFNGEIYNFRELRRDLEARGAKFRTESDTEVVLRAYEAYGPECVQRLRGMFAFAILIGRARPDLRHWLRRGRFRRTSVRAPGGHALRHRPLRAGREAQCARGPAQARLAFRRAFCRLLRHPDVLRLQDHPGARDGGALR